MMKESRNDNDKNDTNRSPLEDIVYSEVEPGIITREMIEAAYLEEGYKGEESRLHRIEPVVYDRIASLRLDFKNILRIDHLWMLPNLTKLSLNCNKIETIEHLDMLVNLKELDLSFNYIERIENLEKLVNLEVLSLFSNLIVKIENLDNLEKLVILSIGNNLISSPEGIERFRFLPNLKVLNLEGNPLAQESEFSLSDYIAAILPKLKYYEYVAIGDEQRESARRRFYRELREIETNEEMELQARSQKLREEENAKRLSVSFVEHLNEHQLYESLWNGDEDGRILMMIGEAANDLAEEYGNDIFELTQEIYKLGLEKYDERQREIDKFHQSIEQGHLEIQQMGHKILEDFSKYKDTLFEEAISCHRIIEARLMRGDDAENEEVIKQRDTLDRITTQFDDTVNNVWQQLMSQELQLHEATEPNIILQSMTENCLCRSTSSYGPHITAPPNIRYFDNFSYIIHRFFFQVSHLQGIQNSARPHLQLF
ncbi:dynein regulatory complex subunit 3 isoform X2 [Musca domestica]|uniref:Dynein axonemal assembly factor 1 homolog n=1 Tax=Musca domestica TaxID=7370 RepID=A0ABM3VEZ4_MUSDO|nr:dynein regulatory complex subunit 3 isoform X2 [Musca domestica]